VEHTAQDQEPWAFGTEVRDISREAIARRYELLPYWYSLFAESTLTGAPLLRTLAWELPGDGAIEAIDDEAMVGPWLLAAPVLEAGATKRTITLPAGRWFEMHSGAVREGPATFDTNVTLAALPLWVREGAILPRGPAMQFSDEKPVDPLRLDVYPGAAASRFTLYEDAGDGMAYQTGALSRVGYGLSRTATGARLTAAPREGSFVPPARRLVVRVHRVDKHPAAVRLDAALLPEVATDAALEAATAAWRWDPDDLSLAIAFADRDDFTLEADYDPSLPDPRPAVRVPLRVAVPANTPAGATVYFASSANGWTQQALAWESPGVAAGTLTVPRGEWFEYKYTRGDWTTVEKWPGCVEATNRYAFGAATLKKDDAVWRWADLCP
jgi:alpha-glucosidase